MLRRTGLKGKVAACAMVFGVSLAMAGCGGESTPIVQTPSGDAPITDAVAKSAAKTKGAGGSLTEGGELTARERRAAKLKEKSPAAK